MQNIRKFGVVGYPLGHSFSKKYFDDFFEKRLLHHCVFENFEMEDIGQIDKLIELNPTLEGFSVTVPHKQNIIPYLTRLEGVAQIVGAVNCVKVIRKGDFIEKIGYNTDVFGFQSSLEDFLGANRDIKALVLGNGGASKAVCVALENMGIEHLVISRSGVGSTLPYEAVTDEIVSSYRLIINSTILGMYPDIIKKPNIPYRSITKQHYGFDLIYNPTETEFLGEFKNRGARYINGGNMLIFQAQEAWEIYNK